MRRIDAIKRRIENNKYYIRTLKTRNYLSALLQRNILFIWIPKSAGTSIFKLLEQNGGKNFFSIEDIKQGFPNRGISTFGHIKILDLVKGKLITQRYFDSAYKFSFVRNPYDRTVSIFFYYKKIKEIDSNIEFKAFCERIYKGDYLKCGLFNDAQLSHCNPQTSYIFDDNDRAIADFIGKFEALENDLSNLALMKGLTYTPVERLNASDHLHYREYYDSESAELIKRAYERDFRLLNYHTEIDMNQ